MLRQAMNVSIRELRELADELEEEDKESDPPIDDIDHKWLISIVNRQPKCSDTWELEGER